MMHSKKTKLIFFSLKRFFWLGLFVLQSSSSGIEQISGSPVDEVIIKVGDVAKLSCPYKMPESRASYKIYWQKEVKNTPAIVASAYVHGRDDLPSKNDRYQNRTKMDEQNLTLSIFSVKVSDSGIYKCVIIKNFDVQNECTVNLSVMADFSDPVINPSINRHCLNQLKLTCSSRGGYPKPKMYIFVNNELVELNYHSESDNQTQLINIAGTLLINVTEDILLINCSVVYLDVQLSTSLTISRDCPPEQPPSHGVVIAIIVIIAFVTLFIVLGTVLRCHTCQHLRSSDSRCSPQPVATNEISLQITGTSEAVNGKPVL